MAKSKRSVMTKIVKSKSRAARASRVDSAPDHASELTDNLQKFRLGWDQQAAEHKINREIAAHIQRAFGDNIDVPSGATDDPNAPPPCDKEQCLIDAVKAGVATTDMTAKIAQLWETAKKEDKSLADAHKKVGRPYKAQRDFRNKWAKCEANKMMKVKGKYKTFGMIWKEEGKDQIAFDIATNVATDCLTKHSQGSTLHGRPWIRKHPQKKYREFLVIEESAEMNDKEVWGYSEVPVGPAVPSEPTGSAGGSGLSPLPAGHEPSVDGDSDATSKQKKLSPEDKKLRKELTTKLAKLKPLKKEAAEACADCTELASVIASSPAWEYANNEPALRGLRKARGEFDAAKTKPTFWSAWMIEDNFPSYAVSRFKTDYIATELARTDTIRKLFETLQTEAGNLK
ncbi:unnamed protein product, partial [Prorocentrum cordatum]